MVSAIYNFIAGGVVLIVNLLVFNIVGLGLGALNVAAGIYLILSYNGLKDFLNNNDQISQEEAFKNLKTYFSIVLVINILTMVFLMLALIVGSALLGKYLTT